METESNDYAPSLIGWVDINDILRAFLQHLEERGKIPASMLQLMTELEREGPLFADKMLITVMGGDDKGLVYQADYDTSVLTAVSEFFLNARDGGRIVHRIAVFDAHGVITSIVSQTDVLRFLCERGDLLGELGRRSVRDLGMLEDKRPVVTIEPHKPTLLAYQAMLEAGVSGAPVVSAAGEPIANLSVSDLRCIQPDHLGVLALPVAEFLALLHNTTYLGYSQRTSTAAAHPFFASAGTPPPASATAGRLGVLRAGSWGGGGGGAVDDDEEPAAAESVRPITCGPDASLAQVISLMVMRRVHRIYVRDPAAPVSPASPSTTPSAHRNQVIGVITPTDVLCLLVGSKHGPCAQR